MTMNLIEQKFMKFDQFIFGCLISPATVAKKNQICGLLIDTGSSSSLIKDGSFSSSASASSEEM